jgi:protein-tyrosine sulfotransferase
MPAPAPILVIGISRRSGTNFLASLLQMHPDCAAPAEPLREDHLLRDADVLLDYTQRAARRWPERWGDRDEARARLARHLGDGLAAFLADGVDRPRVVAKTPSPLHLSLYPQLMPDAHVVVLLRDGRSAVESLVRGFRWSFAKAVEEWRAGADAILDFQRNVLPPLPHLKARVVKYEDLVASPEPQLRELLAFCGLDAQQYDFAAALDAPVIGSSFVRAEGGRLTWQPVERTEGFDPTARYRSWKRFEHERFDHLAGEQQRALGYPSDAHGGATWSVANLASDVARPAVRLRDLGVERYLKRKRPPPTDD